MHLHEIVGIHEHALAWNTVATFMEAGGVLVASLLIDERAVASFTVPFLPLILGSMGGAVLDVLIVPIYGIEPTVAGVAVGHGG